MPLTNFMAAIVLIAADQISKIWLISVMEGRECTIVNGLPELCRPIEITSFFNVVMVWNTGVSFGLFSDAGARVVLGLVNIAVAAALCVWLWRARGRVLRTGLTLVIGGAVGNAIDRFAYGAVADFFDVHVEGGAARWAIETFGSNHWPAFNIADMAISAGVVLLLFDSLFVASDRSKRAP